MSDAQARINRAKELLEGLKKEVAAFFDTKPYEAVVEEEAETGDLVVKVKIRAQPPEQWKITIGEIIHHLRASLDLWIHDLIIKNGNTPTRDTGFPIFDNEADFKKLGNAKLVGIDTNSLAFIKGLNLFQTGNPVIWKLHKLDIEDKHHKLLIAGSTHRSVVIDPMQMFRDMHPGKEFPAMPIALKPAERDFPLQDGSILYRVPARARQSHPSELPKYEFEIAYSDRVVVKDEPLIPSLDSFVSSVEKITQQGNPSTSK
jgi:hypothetical protein